VDWPGVVLPKYLVYFNFPSLEWEIIFERFYSKKQKEYYNNDNNKNKGKKVKSALKFIPKYILLDVSPKVFKILIVFS